MQAMDNFPASISSTEPSSVYSTRARGQLAPKKTTSHQTGHKGAFQSHWAVSIKGTTLAYESGGSESNRQVCTAHFAKQLIQRGGDQEEAQSYKGAKGLPQGVPGYTPSCVKVLYHFESYQLYLC